MLACPLDKGYLHAPMPLQRLTGKIAPALALAARIQTALFIRSVQYVLQHSCAQVANLPGTDHWQDVISPILFYLFNVAVPAVALTEIRYSAHTSEQRFVVLQIPSSSHASAFRLASR